MAAQQFFSLTSIDLFAKYLNNNELTALFKSASHKTVQLFGEIAYNACVAKTIAVSGEEASALLKFRVALQRLLTKSLTFEERRSVLSLRPKLVRLLARCASNHVSQIRSTKLA